MSLQFQTARIEPDIIAVRLVGTVTAGPEGRAIEAAIRTLAQAGEKRLILDLCGVEEIDMGGAEILIRCASALRLSKGELRIATANARVVALLTATRLDNSLPCYRTVARAAVNFKVSKGA